LIRLSAFEQAERKIFVNRSGSKMKGERGNETTGDRAKAPSKERCCRYCGIIAGRVEHGIGGTIRIDKNR